VRVPDRDARARIALTYRFLRRSTQPPPFVRCCTIADDIEHPRHATDRGEIAHHRHGSGWQSVRQTHQAFDALTMRLILVSQPHCQIARFCTADGNLSCRKTAFEVLGKVRCATLLKQRWACLWGCNVWTATPLFRKRRRAGGTKHKRYVNDGRALTAGFHIDEGS